VTRILLYLALLLVGPAGLSIAQEPDLFPVDKNGKTGYIDQTGKLIIPFQFDEAWAFSEGLAPVRIGEDWGYIDASGKIVIKPRFFQASAFSQGFAAVGVYFPRKKIIDSKVGYYNYIDRNGNLLSNEHLAVAFDFSEGLADVMNDDDNRHFFIDKRVVTSSSFLYTKTSSRMAGFYSKLKETCRSRGRDISTQLAK